VPLTNQNIAPAWKAGRESASARTPAYADGSRTVNPYSDGSRTAYGGATSYGGRTPAQGGFGAGSRTPAWSMGGGSGGGDAWGSKTPAPASHDSHQQSSNGWGSNPYDAPTPGLVSAPTPAMNANTPGAFSTYYETPSHFNEAPTPAPWGPTPQAIEAPTPQAHQSYYTAPTPANYNFPETPAAAEDPRYVD